jgi:glycosyltransferase involved in cell wall biosynthesis
MLRPDPLRHSHPSMVSMTTPRRPLSIAHVTGETGFSGGEVQVFLLLEGLRKRGHHNVLLCPPGSRSQREASRRGIESRAIRTRHEWSLRSMWRIRRELLASAPDLVHLHTGRANWLGGLAAWQLGVPALTTRRMDRAVKRNARTRFMYGRVVRRAVAISGAVRARLIEGGVPAPMIRSIASAVDPDALYPQNGRAATRAAAGVAAHTPLLLVVAALVRRKGIDVLIDALARLADERPRPLTWIAGAGPERAALERRVRELGLGASVSFLGERSDVADLLAACDVFILPSRREGLGVAALEAMAAGRAIVATRAGGLPEAIEPERTGLLVPPGDPAALAAALARLLHDPALRARLGAQGPGRVAQSFRADAMVDAYEDLYFELLAEAGRP